MSRPSDVAAGAHRTRLRIVVLQALVLSLFATLLGRLYFLQVVSGEEYTAQAASQSVRDIVEQPQRGLIVDDPAAIVASCSAASAPPPAWASSSSSAAWSPAATRAR